MASIENGTLVYGGGWGTPLPYGGSERYGKPIAYGMTELVTTLGVGSVLVAQPEAVVPASAVEEVAPTEAAARVVKAGRKWRDSRGRDHDTKRQAVLVERVRIAREAFHGAAA